MMIKKFPRPLVAGLAALLMTSTSALALSVEDAIQLIESFYVDAIPASVYEQTTVQDVIDALGDSYTLYMTAEEYDSFLSSMEDTTLVGIGISYTATEEGVLLAEIMPDSAAEIGGLLSGDVITHVNDFPLMGLTTAEVVPLFNDEIGTQVTLTYLRDGAPYTVTLTRTEFTIPNTFYELIDDHICLIESYAFGEDTLTHFDQAFEEYGYADRFIIDLTLNGGGYTSYATTVAGYFVGDQTAGYYKESDGQYYALPTEATRKTLYPAIVLTSSSTASASEIFASAIETADAGIVVGDRTYGKGVSQYVLSDEVLPSFFDGDALKITFSRNFSSKGNTLNVIGVIPDLLVDPNYAYDIALLLSSTVSDDTQGYLRIDLDWRWTVDLEMALSDQYIEAFSALLSALPAHVNVWMGTGGADGWTATTAQEVATAYDVVYVDRSFTDTDQSPYADEIDYLASYYLLNCDSSGAFNPTQELTRGEFCLMLAQALNCTVPTGDSLFSDTPMDTTYGAAVNALARLNLVNGYDDGTFLPDQTITNQDLITIMGRLGEYVFIPFFVDLATYELEVLEDPALADYSSWAKEYAWLLGLSQTNVYGSQVNLLWDEVDTLDPYATATKEEVAYVLYQMFTYTDLLPN